MFKKGIKKSQTKNSPKTEKKGGGGKHYWNSQCSLSRCTIHGTIKPTQQLVFFLNIQISWSRNLTLNQSVPNIYPQIELNEWKLNFNINFLFGLIIFLY